MWPGFNSRRRRHMWIEFVVGSLLCSERFFSGYSGFPLIKIQQFQIPRTTKVDVLPLFIYLFIYLFFNLYIYLFINRFLQVPTIVGSPASRSTSIFVTFLEQSEKPDFLCISLTFFLTHFPTLWAYGIMSNQVKWDRPDKSGLVQGCWWQ